MRMHLLYFRTGIVFEDTNSKRSWYYRSVEFPSYSGVVRLCVTGHPVVDPFIKKSLFRRYGGYRDPWPSAISLPLVYSDKIPSCPRWFPLNAQAQLMPSLWVQVQPLLAFPQRLTNGLGFSPVVCPVSPLQDVDRRRLREIFWSRRKTLIKLVNQFLRRSLIDPFSYSFWHGGSDCFMFNVVLKKKPFVIQRPICEFSVPFYFLCINTKGTLIY